MSKLQEDIKALHRKGLINKHIADALNCSASYVTQTLLTAGLSGNVLNRNKGHVPHGKLKHRTFEAATKSAARLRMNLALLYELTGDEHALDAIDALCVLEDAVSDLRAGNVRKRIRRAA